MTRWLLGRSIVRAPRRLLVAAVGIAFPVAMLASTLLFVDLAVRSMTKVALAPVRLEMRALATSLNVDVGKLGRQLGAVRGVSRVERFAAADVVVGAKGVPGRFTARLFAVDPAYVQHHRWVRTTSGSLARGALLNQQLRTAPGFAATRQITIDLPGGGPSLGLLVPASGTVDLRQAIPWFEIPTGEVQGDVAMLPRALVIDYATFQRVLLPALKARLGTTTPVLNPGLTELPPVTIEEHISIDHSAYPSDPSRAVTWSTALQRVLERQAPSDAVVANDAAETLTLASDDATNAKILFLLLGIPGFLVAAALGLAAESALAEAHRREDALLRLRGATDAQVARLTAAHAIVAGIAGAAVGLVVAALAVTAVTGHSVLSDVSAGRLLVTAGIAVAAGAAVTAFRIVRVVRAGRRGEVATERRLLERGWSPTWRRARLDLVAIGVGLAILLVDVVSGGLKQTQVEGTTVALSFWVLLAPIALWLGLTLFAVRGLLAGLARWSAPGRGSPGTWRGTVLRWLGRRPARTGVALVLGTLAVAFGTYVVAFVATYRQAKVDDAKAAFASDLHLTAASDTRLTPPPLGASVAATSPIRVVPARVGSDRKSVLTLDLSSYSATSTVAPRMLKGEGVDALRRDPKGVLVAKEIADGFAVAPGDKLTLTVFPDDQEKSRNLTFHVLGVYRSVPPSNPPTELVMGTRAVASFLLPPPDFYLARVAPGQSTAGVAAALKRGAVGRDFNVTTRADRVRFAQRSLASLNLGGLSDIESIGAGLVAAVGVAVLGAFLVLERRREFAILRAIGADTPAVLTGPAQEGAVAVLGSIVVGVPLGLGLALVAVRVLGLFFTLPPPLLAIPAGALAVFVLFMLAASTVALGGALLRVTRATASSVLREP